MNWRRRREVTNSILRSYLPLKPPAESEDIVLPRSVEVGRHTYGYDENTFLIFTEGARIQVGAFCSIAPEARILAGGEHVTNRASTFPLNARLFDRGKRNAPDALELRPTVIGNDVWIGLGATVLAGVTVGDGAVVGAKAVLSKSIPPYAVVVGNPAKVAHYRFDSDIQARLLTLRWWDLDDRQIRALKPWFMGDVRSFLAELERVRRSTVGSAA
jgi:acetyltransferase-like isoleucine patch superfamily enzyme